MALSMKSKLYSGVALFGLWLILSGHFSGLLLGLGIASCLFVMWLSRRMAINDLDGAVHLGWGVFNYIGWLVKEVFLCNIQVARIILSSGLPVTPTLFIARASQKTDLGRVVYANSITLTPGTISIEMLGQGESILVHALCDKMTWETDSDMDARICALRV